MPQPEGAPVSQCPFEGGKRVRNGESRKVTDLIENRRPELVGRNKTVRIRQNKQQKMVEPTKKPESTSAARPGIDGWFLSGDTKWWRT